MSWIKLEKDLLTDPRLLSIARKIAAQPCNGRPLPGVITALGGLAYLWMIADTHIGDDDVLALGIDEVNEIIGMQQFCELLPPDWLQVLDANHIKLPHFHAHNGTIAKERAQNNRRVTRHRTRRNHTALPRDTRKALPDQDQDQDHSKKQSRGVFRPQDVPGLDQSAWADWVRYREERKPAIRTLSMPAAAQQMAAMGAKQRAAVDHSIASGYQGLVEPKSAAQPAKPSQDAAWAEARAAGKAIGFREPYPQESVGAYATSVRLASQPTPSPELRARIAARQHERT